MLNFLPTLARWSRATAALAGLVLLAGCDFNFWRMDGHQSTIVVEGPVARDQLNVFLVTCWVTLFLFVVVGGVLAYATIKFTAREGAVEKTEAAPEGHGNPLVELGLIAGSVLALVIIAVPTLKAIWTTYDVPENEKANAIEVTATGYQWWFKFDYHGQQARLDASTATPFVTANELVVPVGQPVRVNLRTVDVIHSFWIPKLAGKVDMIPNRANFLWFKAEKPGYYWGQCAEYCGDSHAVMRFRVIALGPRDYNDWLDQQLQTARNVAPNPAGGNRARPQFAALRSFRTNEAGITKEFDINPLESWRAKQAPEKDEDAELVAQGKALFSAKACITCHAVRGHPGAGVAGPDLTHIGSRSTIAAGLLENNREQLRRWINNPEAVKPGNKMAKGYRDLKIALSNEEEVALVAYLESLK
jgi:cytochrome c oxidase subunit II